MNVWQNYTLHRHKLSFSPYPTSLAGRYLTAIWKPLLWLWVLLESPPGVGALLLFFRHLFVSVQHFIIHLTSAPMPVTKSCVLIVSACSFWNAIKVKENEAGIKLLLAVMERKLFYRTCSFWVASRTASRPAQYLISSLVPVSGLGPQGDWRDCKIEWL